MFEKKCNQHSQALPLRAGHSMLGIFQHSFKIGPYVSTGASVLIKVCVYLVLERLNPVENCVWVVYYRRRVVTRRVREW